MKLINMKCLRLSLFILSTYVGYTGLAVANNPPGPPDWTSPYYVRNDTGGDIYDLQISEGVRVGKDGDQYMYYYDPSWQLWLLPVNVVMPKIPALVSYYKNSNPDNIWHIHYCIDKHLDTCYGDSTDDYWVHCSLDEPDKVWGRNGMIAIGTFQQTNNFVSINLPPNKRCDFYFTKDIK